MIDKGLIVYNDRLGFLIVDGVLSDGRISCNKGAVITYSHLVCKVDEDLLKDRGVTMDDLRCANAHI